MKIYNDNEYQFALGVVEMLWDTPSNVFGAYIDAIEEYEESLVNPDACITMPASLYHKLSSEEYEESLVNKDACIKMPLSLYHKLSFEEYERRLLASNGVPSWGSGVFGTPIYSLVDTSSN